MGKLFPNYSGYIITSPFGMRISPTSGKQAMHNGIDLVATNGSGGCVDYITAHTGGTVEAAGYDSSAGYFVNIRTDKNTIMVYYHMRETPYVKKGATVKAGDKIGYMGSTGNSTGAHLHWGIKQNGAWIDPKPYLESAYTAPVEKVENTESKPTYNVGKTYRTQVDQLSVRVGAGTNYARKTYAQLTANAKQCAYNTGYLKKGTAVTCLEVKTVGSNIWIRIPSGWCAAYYNGKYYIK